MFDRPEFDFSEQDALAAAAYEMGVDLSAGKAACILLALQSEGWELRPVSSASEETE